MNKQQSGFTLIELIMVIVILGILAAVALPKYIDLSTEAGNAAAQGMAGALGSASAINYAARQMADKPTGTASVSSCGEVGQLVQGWTASAWPITGTDLGNCTVTRNGGGSANFIAHAVS